MKQLQGKQSGFSVVELMVGSVLGLMLSLAIMLIYFAQTGMYKTANAQAQIQSAENAIANLMTPVIRSAGFTGCGSISSALSNLNGGGSAPLGNLNTTTAMVNGYNGGTGTILIAQDNPANDNTSSHWTPSLESGLTGQVQAGNDVLVVLGAVPGTIPVGITTINSGSDSFVIQGSNGMTIAAGGYGAVSDCSKTSIFQITGVSGATISHLAGAGNLDNASSSFAVNYNVGSQFIPMQQTAFFVGQGPGGQSALMRGILNAGNWTIQPLVPGVELMKVQFGTGTSGIVTKYVTADGVTDWSRVYTVRLGFIIEGEQASGGSKTSNPNQFTVLGTTVTTPVDNKIRHVFEMTISLRNAIS